jgi:hypothetical protein
MKVYSLLILFVSLLGSVCSQGVGINNSGAAPDPSAILDAASTTQGFLPPRMTTAERDSIQNPAEGLLIYNTSKRCFEAFYGTFWQSMHCGCSNPPSDLSFADNGPLTYCLNQSILPNPAITQGGNPTTFQVSPVLPAGLFLNQTTGQLSGIPLIATGATSYSFSASNACGSTSKMLDIEIIATPDTPSVISGPSAPTINTTVNYSILAAAGASSYTWTVPVGWTINSGQGTTTINITAGTNAGNITVTATNSCGTSFPATKAVTSWRPIAASGGTITNYTANGSNGINGILYRVHSYLNVGNSSFIVSDAGSDSLVDYLIVAGGGGGGSGTGGGGGAGGVRTGSSAISVNSFTVSVGNGGGGGSSSQQSQNGTNSSFLGLTAIGGGRGGGNMPIYASFSGGSGGGGSELLSGGSGTAGQGNNGGMATNWSPPHYGTGGGGGAGAVGGNGNTLAAGNGGNGVQSSITGTALFYGGGGGGGSYNGGTLGIGGLGGGGATPAGNGQPNTGGGGGGQCNNSSAAAGSGGSGIVIIRYPLSNPNP